MEKLKVLKMTDLETVNVTRKEATPRNKMLNGCDLFYF